MLRNDGINMTNSINWVKLFTVLLIIVSCVGHSRHVLAQNEILYILDPNERPLGSSPGQGAAWSDFKISQARTGDPKGGGYPDRGTVVAFDGFGTRQALHFVTRWPQYRNQIHGANVSYGGSPQKNRLRRGILYRGTVDYILPDGAGRRDTWSEKEKIIVPGNGVQYFPKYADDKKDRGMTIYTFGGHHNYNNDKEWPDYYVERTSASIGVRNRKFLVSTRYNGYSADEGTGNASVLAHNQYVPGLGRSLRNESRVAVDLDTGKEVSFEPGRRYIIRVEMKQSTRYLAKAGFYNPRSPEGADLYLLKKDGVLRIWIIDVEDRATHPVVDLNNVRVGFKETEPGSNVGAGAYTWGYRPGSQPEPNVSDEPREKRLWMGRMALAIGEVPWSSLELPWQRPSSSLSLPNGLVITRGPG